MIESLQQIQNENNILARLRTLEEAVATLQMRNTEAEALDELADNMGELREGRFITGDLVLDDENGAHSGTGTFMGDSVVIDAIEYVLGVLREGKRQFGITSDGYPRFNSAIFDEDGFRFEEGGDTITLWGANKSMFAAIGHSAGGFRLLFCKGLGAELVLNGDFANGLTNWTVTGTVSAVAADDRTGYAAQLAASAVFVSAANFAVTAGSHYVVSALLKLGSVQPPSVKIEWYNAGGAKISDDLMTRDSVEDVGWLKAIRYFTAPALATQARVYIAHPVTAPPQPSDGLVTQISVRSATIVSSLALDSAYDQTIYTDCDIWTAKNVLIDGILALRGGGTLYSNLSSPDGYNYAGDARTISNNGVHSFTPGKATGMIVVISATHYVLAAYNTAAPTCTLIVGSSVAVVTTGVLTGTTGTVGKLTVSAHTDGKVYIENRVGAARNVSYVMLAG